MPDMATPGWLDIHGHFSPPRTASEDAATVKAFRQSHFFVSETPKWDADQIIAYNDRAGVAMQMLSNLPPTLEKLQASNDFGLSIVRKYPSRFGLLTGLPTGQPEQALAEIERLKPSVPRAGSIQPDGFAVTTVRNGVGLGDRRLRVIWAELNERREVIFVHPNAYAQGSDGRPAALIDVAFDTARTITDMLYNRVFLDFPNIRWVFAHSGGAFPVLSGRIMLLGAQDWVPNEFKVTRGEIREQVERIFVDTAATAETGMEPAIKMTGIEHIIYGADCGVPCSTEATMDENRKAVRNIAQKYSGDADTTGLNGFGLFPEAKIRAMGGNH